MRSYLDHILKFLLVLVVISAAAALYLFNLQDKARASIGNIARNEAAFGCMQGKTELAVVEVALLELLANRTPATAHAVATSAQILLSRIESLDSGAAGLFFRARPAERIRITQFRRTAESLETLASVSTHADVTQGIGLVRDMWPTFEQLCTNIQQFSGDLLMEAKDTLSHSTTAFTYLLGGFLASGLALLAILFFQNKVVRRSLLTQRAIARENYRLANHDPLTGLGNRSLFSIALDALSRRTADDTYACLLMIDLDRFKLVNDNLGHSAGDALLISIATRLSQLEREDPAVQAYRLGGDEFVVLLRGATHQHQALELAHHVMQLLRPAHDLGGHTVAIAVSIGVATVPIRHFDQTTLFRHADLAVH